MSKGQGKQQRSIWSGAIGFGLVHVPVRLYTATAAHDLGFHQYDAKTKHRIEYKRVAGGSGNVVPYESIVKGYEISKGKVVLLDPEELEALAPKKSRTIEIEQFVSMSEIDPIAWDQTYYLAPADEAAGKTYELFRRALEESGKVAIGRFVMRTREYLATIRPLGPGLAIETMFYADEIRSQGELDLPQGTQVGAREMALAKQLIDTLTGTWDHGKFKDTYRDSVLALVEKKGRGETITTEVEESAPADVIDLMAALQASLSGPGKTRVPSGASRAERGEEEAPARAAKATVRRKAGKDATTKVATKIATKVGTKIAVKPGKKPAKKAA